MSNRTFTLRHCPFPAAHAVELRVCNIIDRVSNSAPVCTKETDDTPSLWSISGTQGIPHLCPRQSKSPRSQTLVLLWTRRCVCVESPGPTGLFLLASTINKIMLVRSSRLYKFARRTKNITECRLIRQRWPGYCRSLQTFQTQKAPCLRWVDAVEKWDFLAAAAAG